MKYTAIFKFYTGQCIGWRPMSNKYVKIYFKTIKKTKDGQTKIPGQYCDRCGINFGEDYLNKEGYPWDGFYICASCLKDKQLGLENTPDLEDLKKLKYEV